MPFLAVLLLHDIKRQIEMLIYYYTACNRTSCLNQAVDHNCDWVGTIFAVSITTSQVSYEIKEYLHQGLGLAGSTNEKHIWKAGWLYHLT